MVKSFDEVHDVLLKYMPPARAQRGNYTLVRMRKLMDALGNPQEKYQVIHVAGTSGKTSTCYYLAAFLDLSDRKVGLTVSPHIDEVNERLQINLKPMPEVEYCQKLTRFLDIIEQSTIKPTYFELLVAFAYWVFANQQVDYAVVEVGLGGLLDGTNVVRRADKICVITDVDLDHTEILGNTYAEVAAQKAGIIQTGNTVFTYRQNSEIMSAIRTTAEAKHAYLREIAQPKLTSNELPLFQQRNWYLAKNAYDYVGERDKLAGLSDSKIQQTKQTYIPARMETVKIDNKTLIIDGSHNGQKVAALMASLKQKFPGQKPAALVSFVKSEESRTRDAIRQLSGDISQLIITTFSGRQDTPKISVDPKKVAEFCELAGLSNYQIIENPADAYHELLKQPKSLLLITGSFYLLNHIRPLIFKK